MYSASGKELIDVNSTIWFFAVLLKEFFLHLLPGLLRNMLRKDDTVYSGLWAELSSMCYVVLKDLLSKNHLLDVLSTLRCAVHLSRLTYIGRCMNFPKWKLWFSSFLTFGRPSGERRLLNTDILLYANNIMYVILL